MSTGRNLVWTSAAIGLVLAVLVGCSSDGGDARDATAPDAVADVVADTAGDTALPEDAGPETGPPPGDVPGDTGEQNVILARGGVTATAETDGVLVDNGRVQLRYHASTCRFDLMPVGEGARIEGAVARATFRVDGHKHVAATSDPGSCEVDVLPYDDTLGDPIGSGIALVVHHVPDGPAPYLKLGVAIELRGGDTFVTARVDGRWHDPDGTAEEVRFDRLSPLVVETELDGRLFVGPDPRTHRVLDNGFDMFFDFQSRVLPATVPGSILHQPGISSNWNMAIHDPESGRSLVAGFLSSERAIPLLVSFVHPDTAPVDDETGAISFTRFEAFAHYEEGRAAPAPEGPGDAGLTSEILYVDIAPPTIFDGLENYARRYAQRIGKVVRDEVPTGWNSWGGGYGSGGYGTNIDEELILDNLEAAAADFLPWGMEWFMLDDGWQIADGDWFPRTDRFPVHGELNGIEWLADEIERNGMKPGIWISPFDMKKNSQLAADHPEWAADVNAWGASFVPDDVYVLDLSRPEVRDFLAETFRRITEDWGYRWIKMDFTYYALFATNLHDPDVTASEVYKQTLYRLREAMAPGTFFCTITPMGLAYDVADGNRLGLDTEPWWGGPDYPEDAGIADNYPTVARRYYLNHTLWKNHPDLVYFRDSHGLTFNEGRAWLSVVGLTGGILKLGDSYLFLDEYDPGRLAIQQLLPVYPHTGRPLDMFLRELPERWSLPVEREGREWHVLGLFNWGFNRDIGADDWEAEQARTYDVDLADLGLDPTAEHLVFDAWERTWSWVSDGQLNETVPPRTERVLVLRPAPVEPAVVFTSRHLLGGAVEVHDEAFDAATGILSASIDTVPGEELVVYVAPAGADATDADGSSVPVTLAEQDGLVTATLMPTESSTELRLHLQ